MLCRQSTALWNHELVLWNFETTTATCITEIHINEPRPLILWWLGLMQWQTTHMREIECIPSWVLTLGPDWITVVKDRHASQVWRHQCEPYRDIQGTPLTSQRWRTRPPIPSLTRCVHYQDVTMGTMASQITSLTIVYSSVYSDADQRKHQSSASLAFVRWIQRASNAENVSIWWRHHVY